jgi:hypothetical protein
MVMAYPDYRDSGLPWVARLPDGWQVLRNGRLFAHRVQTGFPDLPILEVSLRTGVRVRDMENGKRKQVMSQKENYKRAVKGDIAYNMKSVSRLATQLAASYGRSYEARNLRRMMQFAGQFPDFEIVSALTTQLSWTHVVEVLPLKSSEARLFYLGEAANRQLGTRDLRHLITRKAFERKEIANAQLTESSNIPPDTFKDPYLLDVLGLRDGYLEADLETAILRELEARSRRAGTAGRPHRTVRAVQ